MAGLQLPRRDRRALVDTGAYFALTDPRDSNHPAALRVQQRIIAERWRLFTTNFIISETHALLIARLGRSTAARVLEQLDRTAQVRELTVVRVSASDEQRAREILRQYDDKDFSLTDATSFAVMERVGISQVFAFDRHFSQYGFLALA